MEFQYGVLLASVFRIWGNVEFLRLRHCRTSRRKTLMDIDLHLFRQIARSSGSVTEGTVVGYHSVKNLTAQCTSKFVICAVVP